MRSRLSIAFALLVITVMTSCKKGSDGPAQAEFQAITLKFGADATPINIDQATKTIKNLPRSWNPAQLVAAAALPSGFTISPDPSVVKDYTGGVTYTVTNAQGGVYTIKIIIPVYDAVNNPYGIYTPKHLNDVRNGLNDSYVLMNDIDMPALNSPDAAASVGISDYASYGWYSIGIDYIDGGDVIFSGSFDGQNHVIRNLTMSFRPGSAQPAGMDVGHFGKSVDGLFGYAVHATLKNIGIQLATSGINDLLTDDGLGKVGGLVGMVDSSTITNCFVSGNASIASRQYTGGLIGKAFNSTISKSYSSLTPAGGTAAIKSGSDAGGLIGWAFRCTITDCYSSNSTLSSVSAGGLIGNISTCTIKTSFASGNVTEPPVDAVSGIIPPNSLGGLVGSVNSISPELSIIQDCYATGSVSGANGADANFHKNSRIGGLIGQVNPASGPVSVTFCYVTGAVSRVHTSATVPYLIGGLAGTTNNNVFISSSNCTNYWNTETTGQSTLGGGNGALAADNAYTTNGKTTAQMKTQSTFVNWDFSSVWTVAAGTNNGYPSFRSH